MEVLLRSKLLKPNILHMIYCIFYFTFGAQLANMVIYVYALKDRNVKRSF